MALRLSRVPQAHLGKVPKKLKRSAALLRRELEASGKHVSLLRTDGESRFHERGDLDLSDKLGWFSPYETRNTIDFAAQVMLKALSRFDFVRTDRLHVGIAAALTGADVELLDNSYGKLSGVYAQSLHTLPHVSFNKQENKQ